MSSQVPPDLRFTVGDILYNHNYDKEMRGTQRSNYIDDHHDRIPQFWQITRMTKATAFLTKVKMHYVGEDFSGCLRGNDTWAVKQPIEYEGEMNDQSFRLKVKEGGETREVTKMDYLIYPIRKAEEQHIGTLSFKTYTRCEPFKSWKGEHVASEYSNTD